MQPPSAIFQLEDDAHSARFGAALGRCLRPGDTVLLQGPLGAGKSHIARAAIRALVGADTDVPSPTFTLVQVYDGPLCEIWHADLYRLTGPDEVVELGLHDAMEQAIALVEWPERLGADVPAGAVWLRLEYEGNARQATLTGARDGIIAALRAVA